MPPPEPMLSSSARRWPDGADCVLQPKWDGFRLLVEVALDGQVRAWTRHATNLTDRLSGLLPGFALAPAGTTFDGELVAISLRDDRPVQDFAAVTRAVFNADRAASARFQFVAFDVLHCAGADMRTHPWRARDAQLREALPVGVRIRAITTQPATPAAHAAIVELGFEGTVLKRPRSTYRAGRHTTWVKHKARCHARGVLLSVHQECDGQWTAMCEVEGRRVWALASAHAHEFVGATVELAYSRVDADGGLREARLTTR